MSNREPIPPVAIPGGDPAAPARFPAQDSRLLTMFEIAKILATEHDQGMMLQKFLATLIQTCRQRMPVSWCCTTRTTSC